jgi:hypothetical protein
MVFLNFSGVFVMFSVCWYLRFFSFDDYQYFIKSAFHQNKQAIKQDLKDTKMLFSRLTKIIMSQHDIGHVIEAI